MKNEKFERMLNQVALAYHTTPEQVRKEMELALKQGQQSRDPKVQALWDAIPRTGPALTLEEFVEYLVQTLYTSYSQPETGR